MSVWLTWLLVSAVLIVAEIFTLSFYLILAGLGALAAAGLAYFDFSMTAQILAAAIITLAGWGLVGKFRKKHDPGDHRSNPDLNMDIGTEVRLAGIAPDGKAFVMLRGAKWDAKIDHGHEADADKLYVITKIDGSTLILHPKHGH